MRSVFTLRSALIPCMRHICTSTACSSLPVSLSSNHRVLPQLRQIHNSAVTRSQEAVEQEQAVPHRYLAPRKTVRKRRPLTVAYDYQPVVGPQVVSIAVAESFDLQAVAKDNRLLRTYQPTCVDEDSDEALHFVPKDEYLIDKDTIREFFVFNDGVVVFWGMDSPERFQALHCLESHAEFRYDSRVVHDETDTMSFALIDQGESGISNDQLLLNVVKHQRGHCSNSSILERYSFSHGMAASVKVAIWESQLSEQAEPLLATTKSLSQGVIPWGRKQALRKTGQFSQLRHSINLNCNLLSADFYWEREELEYFYEIAMRHFTVPRRLKLLNDRLDYCEDLVKLIDGMLSHRHASTLEWMIIVLIVIEVIFDIWSFVDSRPKKVIVVREIDAAADSAK